MATNKVQVTEQTPIVWADTTDYSSTVSGLTRTDQIDLTSLGFAAARQGAKKDMGATRNTSYLVCVAVEFASGEAPVSGEVVSYWWASSPSATAGNANPGGTSGADAAYTGTAGDSLADSIKQLDFIGNLILTSDATTTVQYGVVGVIHGRSILRYGMPVVYNESAADNFVADAVEMYVALIPIDPDIQAAA